MTTKQIQGPYFAVGDQVYKHWPGYPVISDEEKKHGPDFVENYSTAAAARRDAAALNKEWAAKQPLPPPAASAPQQDLETTINEDKLWEAHLDRKAAAQQDPREEGWL